MDLLLFFFSSRRRHTRCGRDWSSDVCSSDLAETDIENTIVRCEIQGLDGAAVDAGVGDVEPGRGEASGRPGRVGELAREERDGAAACRSRPAFARLGGESLESPGEPAFDF